ncbi:MAG: methylated-DNA--[protein]-cysteine S-methyltransferase [candidate division NC10 bacterium]|nr:methylated-DNA--[protein]-cysteine S-methyltransferase [candidate division NC10 bacterium]
MSDKPAVCVRIADDLLATAIGEASPRAAERVERHVAMCGSCRRELQGYRALDGTVATMRAEPHPSEQAAQARERLETKLADLRRRLLAYRVFPSPLGHILIARSELGISLVEYLDRGTSLKASRLANEPGVEIAEGGEDLEAAYQDLTEYLSGRRQRFDWPLDLRLARSDFQRAVLQATAAIPYGAVVSYMGLAHDIGKASAPRAVAQALRWNPLPIVIPCHRVIGTSGALTGYAGSKLGLKHKAAPLTRFGSRQHAESVGLAPCTTCRPDLHPISR